MPAAPTDLAQPYRLLRQPGKGLGPLVEPSRLPPSPEDLPPSVCGDPLSLDHLTGGPSGGSSGPDLQELHVHHDGLVDAGRLSQQLVKGPLAREGRRAGANL